MMTLPRKGLGFASHSSPGRPPNLRIKKPSVDQVWTVSFRLLGMNPGVELKWHLDIGTVLESQIKPPLRALFPRSNLDEVSKRRVLIVRNANSDVAAELIAMLREGLVVQDRCLRNETALGSGDLGGRASTDFKLLYQPVGTE